MPTLIHTTADLVVSPGSSFAETIPATTAGHCLIVVVSGANGNGTAAVTGMLLGAGADNFAQVKAVENADSVNGLWTDAAVWIDPNCAGGQTSVTVNLNANWATATSIDITVWEVDFSSSTVVLDQFSTGTGTGTAYSSGTTPATTAAAEFWVGAAFAGAGLTLPASGWTDSGVHAIDGNAGHGSHITTATGTAIYNGTAGTGALEDWAALAVTFKAGGAGPAPSQFRLPKTPSRGARGTRPGRTQHLAGRVEPPSPFQLPARPARGPSGTRRGRTAALSVPPVIVVPGPPSPFQLPRTPVRGPAGTRRGRGQGLSVPPVITVPPPPSPFTLPRTPRRGPAQIRRGVTRFIPGVIPVTPVIPSGPVSGGDRVHPWRKHPWPRTPIGLPLIDIGAITAVAGAGAGILPPDPAGLAPETGASAEPAGPAGPGAAERARTAAKDAIAAAAAAAARNIPDSGALADPDVGDAVAYWQQQRNNRKRGT